MVGEFYDGYRDYPDFQDWYDDVVTLFDDMETGQHWPGGTLPAYLKSGWLGYASDSGYGNYDGWWGSFGENLSTQWAEVASSIEHFQPVPALWVNIGIAHYETVVGYDAAYPSKYHLNDGWGGQTWVQVETYSANYYPVYLWPTGRLVGGTVTLQGGMRPTANKVVELQVKVFDPDDNVTWSDWNNSQKILAQATVKTMVTLQGEALEVGFASPTFSGLSAGTYDVAVKTAHTLANIYRDVYIDDSGNGAGTLVNMGTLREGNCNDDGIINSIDFSILAASYLKASGQQGYDARADFDYSGQVACLDFSLLASNYLKTSFQVVSGDSLMGGEGLLTLGTADLTLQPSSQTVSVNQTFNVTIQAASGSQQVGGIDSFIDFDPDYLEVVSITNGTALPIENYNQYDNQIGTIDFSDGKTGTSLPSGTFTVATIQFRAKAATAGTSLTFVQTEGRNTDAAYVGDSILGSVTGATVVIQP